MSLYKINIDGKDYYSPLCLIVAFSNEGATRYNLHKFSDYVEYHTKFGLQMVLPKEEYKARFINARIVEQKSLSDQIQTVLSDKLKINVKNKSITISLKTDGEKYNYLDYELVKLSDIQDGYEFVIDQQLRRVPRIKIFSTAYFLVNTYIANKIINLE